MPALTEIPRSLIKHNNTPETRCVVRRQVHHFTWKAQSERKFTIWLVTETIK